MARDPAAIRLRSAGRGRGGHSRRPGERPGARAGGGGPMSETPDRLAATERRETPTTPVEAADLADKYDQMLRLADLFDDSGEEMRQRAELGRTVLADDA